MECRRCQGLMVEDQFFDFEGTHGFMWMKGWRCINCGHAADPLLEANRRLHEATMLVQPSEEAENENEHGTVGPKPSHGLPHDDGVRSTHTHTKEFRPVRDEQERLVRWQPF